MPISRQSQFGILVWIAGSLRLQNGEEEVQRMCIPHTQLLKSSMQCRFQIAGF